jgi:hypothetical protein
MAPGGGLHPGIGNEYPEGGQRGAQRHHARGKEMHAARDSAPPEVHDAHEPCLQHEGHRTLETEYVAEIVAAEGGERRPVGAELEFQRQATDDPNGEIEHEKTRPETGVMVVVRIAGSQPQRLDRHQEQ